MRQPSPLHFLEDIVEAFEKIQRYCNNLTAEQFIHNSLIVDAVLRNLEVIGEAANNLSPEIRKQNPDIPWSQMIGLRNIVIHEYFGVDLGIIWHIVSKNIPETYPLIVNLSDEIHKKNHH